MLEELWKFNIFLLMTASQICWSWVGLAIMPPYTKDKARLIPNSIVRIWIDSDNALVSSVLMHQYDASHLNVYHIIFNLIKSNVGGIYVCKSLLTKYRREPDSLFFSQRMGYELDWMPWFIFTKWSLIFFIISKAVAKSHQNHRMNC